MNACTYFLARNCLKWWKTLMTSRIRRGASSILDARLMQAMATIWEKRKWQKIGRSLIENSVSI